MRKVCVWLLFLTIAFGETKVFQEKDRIYVRKDSLVIVSIIPHNEPVFLCYGDFDLKTQSFTKVGCKPAVPDLEVPNGLAKENTGGVRH